MANKRTGVTTLWRRTKPGLNYDIGETASALFGEPDSKKEDADYEGWFYHFEEIGRLVINIRGDHAGRYLISDTHENGNAVQLVQKAMGFDIKHALEWLKEQGIPKVATE